MEIILMQDVKALGKKGEIVKVNDGYARNFILPKKLGMEATKQNLYDLNLQKAAEEKRLKGLLEEAKNQAKKLEELTITVSIKAGEGGKTFGSVSTKEIAEAAKKQFNQKNKTIKTILHQQKQIKMQHQKHSEAEKQNKKIKRQKNIQ